MNIFVLDTSTRQAAKMHCDKHVVKMPLETAQLLCTAHQILDGYNGILYKATHIHHPCSVWVRESQANYIWLYMLFRDLAKEYTHRYGKQHLSWTKLEKLLQVPPKNIPQVEQTPFAQAMPDDCKCDDPVDAYRAYYNTHKQHLHNWSKRPAPEWIDD
jgi:hypothetical protein